MKILLLGANGYFGQAIAERLRERGVTHFLAVSHKEHDYTNFWNIRQLLRQTRPTAVINAAAFVCKPSVDLNEQQKEETLRVNTFFPITLANACEATGTKLLHISTGCLYNHLDTPIPTIPASMTGFSEEATPQLTMDRGAGIYVASKLLGEEQVQKYDQAWICRVRLPFDMYENPRNLITKYLTYPKIYCDTNSLTHRGDFADAAIDIIQKQIPFGVYHCTNPGAITTREILAWMIYHRLLEKMPELWDHLEFHQAVTTLKSNCVLNTDKLAKAGVAMRPVQEAMKCSVTAYAARKYLATASAGP